MTSRPTVPVLRPLLPTAASLLPYLEQIDAARWYSNMGPLATRLEAALAEHFGRPVEQVVTSANGTLALVQTLRALDVAPGRLCVMPSWTFVATPAAAEAAGLTPYFADVDAAGWTLQPQTVAALVAEGLDVGAVIPVAPFGAPLDLAAWEAFQAQTGVPVVIDAAAAFDSFAGLQTTLPVMVSLHATKVFGVGEGAVMLTGDVATAHAIRQAGNFGFHGSREARTPGFNAKLSEYTAAVGLAGFDHWAETRAGWQDMTQRFVAKAQGLARVRTGPGLGDGWISSYGLLELDGPHADRVCEALAARGVETRRWWGKGCHVQPAYRDCPRGPLPNTEDLAERVIGLPFWIGLEDASLEHVFESLGEILSADAG